MEKFRGSSSWLAIAFVIAVCFIWIWQSGGGSAALTYVYEATTSAPGSFEFETWVTWKTSPSEEHPFNAVDFRHEIEFGVTEHCKQPCISPTGDTGRTREQTNMDSVTRTRRSS